MTDFKSYFRGKKITVMGLGVLGRGLGYTKFLAECGADLVVTDLKPAAALTPSLRELRKYKNIKYVLGRHRLEDFRGRDIVIKAAGVPMDSPYIKEARKHKIPIEMDVSFFMKLAPEITLVGVTGTRGKSTTTMLIYEILSKNLRDRKVYVGGNIRGVATLPLLKKIKSGDVLVCELDSWQLQGFGDAKISPNISVFTSFMPDHLNYYTSAGLTPGAAMKKYLADKTNIFKYQKRGDFLVVRPGVANLIPRSVKSRVIKVKAGTFPEENLACAVAVAKIFKIKDEDIARTVKSFKGLPGRLQHLRTVNGVKIYNDNNATIPEATMAGMEILDPGKKRNIVLIAGGSDKKLPLRGFGEAINKHCRAVVLIPGTGTDRLKKLKNAVRASSLKEAVEKATKLSRKGDIILFSPAFASFGMFRNEYDRGDQFMRIVQGL